MNYYIYILQCRDNSFYIGITNNLEKRIYEHQEGFDVNCYTYTRRPLKYFYSECFNDVHEALLREKQIKGWSRKKKKALINENWNKLIELSRNYTEYKNDTDSHGSTGSP